MATRLEPLHTFDPLLVSRDPLLVNKDPPSSDPIETSIPTVPFTSQRRPYLQTDLSHPLQHLGTARANLAPSVESPHGTTTADFSTAHSHQTVLQSHVSFFDRRSSGIIRPHDTFFSFLSLGYNIFFSLLSVIIIHGAFSYWTLDSWLPDPFFRIHVKNIHRDKHGSDTGAYDHEGRFVPQAFEDVFSKYAGGRDWVGVWEVWELLKGQRNIVDPVGWGGAVFEWLATYLLLWPDDGRMMKEDLRGIYDGSLFYSIAERRASFQRRRLY